MVWACAAVVGAVVVGLFACSSAMLAEEFSADKKRSDRHGAAAVVNLILALALAFLAGWLAH